MKDSEMRRYRYVGLAMPERKGHECVCLVWPPFRAAKKNALVQFADGYKTVVPARTLRVSCEKRNGTR